jgi:hypothetical protein
MCTMYNFKKGYCKMEKNISAFSYYLHTSHICLYCFREKKMYLFEKIFHFNFHMNISIINYTHNIYFYVVLLSI